MALTALVSGALAAIDPEALDLRQNSQARQDLARTKALVDFKYEQLRQASNAAAGRDYLLCTRDEYLAAGDVHGDDSDVIKAEGCVSYKWISDQGVLLVFVRSEPELAAVRLPVAAWPFAKLVLVTAD